MDSESSQKGSQAFFPVERCGLCGGTGWVERKRDGSGGYTEVLPCRCLRVWAEAMARQRAMARQQLIDVANEREPVPENPPARRDLAAVFLERARQLLGEKWRRPRPHP